MSRTKKSTVTEINQILYDLLIEIVEIVGDEFAPKQANGSPERQRLLGLITELVPLLHKTEAKIEKVINET